MKKPPLRVKTNPFHSVGPEGQPSGVVAEDLGLDPTTRALVGAKLDRERTIITKAGVSGDALRHSLQETRYVFDLGVIELPDTAYYRRRIQDGELLAADEATARSVGIKFVDPEITRKAAKDAARKAFDATYGEGSFDSENAPQAAPSASAEASETTDTQEAE